MITREILQAQRSNYVHGRETMSTQLATVSAQLSALNGGIEAIDNLLRILDQRDELVARQEESAKASANGAEPELRPAWAALPGRAHQDSPQGAGMHSCENAADPAPIDAHTSQEEKTNA